MLCNLITICVANLRFHLSVKAINQGKRTALTEKEWVVMGFLVKFHQMFLKTKYLFSIFSIEHVS